MATENAVETLTSLKAQWEARLEKRNAAIKDQDEMRRQMQLERERSATRPAADLAPAGVVPRATSAPAE